MTTSRSRRWWILAAALVVQITVSVVVQGFPALVPFVKPDLHLSVAQAGVFATVPALGTFFSLLAVGWAVDRLGDRTVLVVGGISTGLLTLAAAYPAGYLVLLLVLGMVGIGSGSPTPAGSSAVMKEFPLRQRGVVMSIRQTGVPIGGALAAVVLPAIAIVAGWRPALVAAALVAIAGGLACLFFYRQAGGQTEPQRMEPGPRRVLPPFTRNLFLTSCTGILFVVSQFSLVSFLVLYLHHTWGLALVAASFLLAATQLAGAGGRIGWGWVSDRVFGGSRKRTLVVASLFAAATDLSLGWLPAHAPLWLVAVVVLTCGAGSLGWNGVYIILLAELAKPGFEGRSIALGMTLNQPAIVAGPWVFGLLVDMTGSYRLGWTAVAAGLLLGALAISRVKEPRIPRIPISTQLINQREAADAAAST